jgi:hypothetical protein
MCKCARLITVMFSPDCSSILDDVGTERVPSSLLRSLLVTDAHACRASGTVAVPDVREVDTGVVGPADHSWQAEPIRIAGER